MTDTPRTAADMPLPGGEFSLFITRISFQGLLACGVLENPVTQEKQTNQPMATALIKDLEMLQAKTSGNLDPDEEAHLAKVVGDLRAVYDRIFAGAAGS
jgi:hypothetical protein